MIEKRGRNKKKQQGKGHMKDTVFFVSFLKEFIDAYAFLICTVCEYPCTHRKCARAKQIDEEEWQIHRTISF